MTFVFSQKLKTPRSACGVLICGSYDWLIFHINSSCRRSKAAVRCIQLGQNHCVLPRLSSSRLILLVSFIWMYWLINLYLNFFTWRLIFLCLKLFKLIWFCLEKIPDTVNGQKYMDDLYINQIYVCPYTFGHNTVKV